MARRIGIGSDSRTNATWPSAKTMWTALPWKLNGSLFGPQSWLFQMQPSPFGSGVLIEPPLLLLRRLLMPDALSGLAQRHCLLATGVGMAPATAPAGVARSPIGSMYAF